MNLEKLRKATELMREALADLDLSTESQGASGGCGAGAWGRGDRGPKDQAATHKAALDRLSALLWWGSWGPVNFVGYPYAQEQAPITLDHVAIAGSPWRDAEERGRRARYGWRANQSA